MGPPLMAYLMSGHIERNIDRFRIYRINVSDKTNRFGVRNGIRKRLSKGSITREFNNAFLVELERAEVGAGVVQGRLHTVHHAVEIEFVAGLVIDFEVHIAP